MTWRPSTVSGLSVDDGVASGSTTSPAVAPDGADVEAGQAEPTGDAVAACWRRSSLSDHGQVLPRPLLVVGHSQLIEQGPVEK